MRIADAAMTFLQTVAPDGELRLPIAKPFAAFQAAVRRA